ncbi:MAG TPA: hypothetical protein PK052_09650 [Anaerohalosphaeraceae bacterium]|nr:LamG domain-containing protein [Phycisphaerae bacterium]HOK96336.1 hypothetical protein [Anaerohalosphaeraceae bacterium]HOL32233.1 hypothetical protein [Anaerohalosphaeraceae bacterium]HOM75840.1 hypothetical protein [Anaerohalosphaeraceae bacterium]HPC65163.1 hypothetical protein [Anaerohalosphaeraceae bacterium]
MENGKRVLLGVFLVMVGLLQAVTIEWVSDDYGSSFDQPWINLLTSQGYTVTARANQYYRTLDAAKIAALNAADLVIISRKTSSGDYASNSTEVAQWNGLTAPVLCMSGFLARSSRWKWLNADQNEADAIMKVLDPSHPFFWGVPLDANNQVDTIATGVASVIATTNPGNSTVLATRASDQYIWIAKWDTGQEYYPGSGQYAGGPRVFCGMGQDVSGSAFNVTEAGKSLFLNIVYEMSGAAWNRKPLVNAGPDRIAYIGNAVALAGSAIDPEATVMTISWTQVSGPAAASIADASAAATTAAFSAAGTYVLKLEASDGELATSDTMTVYVRDPAKDTLIAHWDFDGLPDPNTLIDVSGHGFDGIYHRTTPGEPNVVPGHITGSLKAADFMEISYWEIPNARAGDPNFNDIQTGATFAVWAKADAQGAVSTPVIFGFGIDAVRFQINANRWNLVQTGLDVFSVRPVFDGFWHHVAGVYDGVNAQFKIYVDGVLDGTTATPSGYLLTTGAFPPQIGNRADAVRMWPGQMDDLRVYNYALSDAQIAALAAEGDLIPYLTAGIDQTVQYTGAPVPLDATLIVNDGIPAPMALSWSVTKVPAGVDPEDVIFSDKTAEDPLVTFPTVAGTYVLKLTGSDGVVEVSDEVSLVILIPTCADILAEGLGMAADLSGPAGVPDCYVNMYDLAAMAASWLTCNNPEDTGCIWPY